MNYIAGVKPRTLQNSIYKQKSYLQQIGGSASFYPRRADRMKIQLFIPEQMFQIYIHLNYFQIITKKMDQKFQVYHHITGTVCLIGYGSIGKGFIPLLKRHLTYDRFVIIDPTDVPPENACDEFIKVALVKENYKEILDKVFGDKPGFCVNLSVGTSSKQLIVYCQQRKTPYVDTVKEQWEGYYADPDIDLAFRSNYGLRYSLLKHVRSFNLKSTAISCCGANPGMVSWFVKQALMNIAHDIEGGKVAEPQNRQEWGQLMMKLGVKGVHVAQRDTQRSAEVRPMGHFWNTWSVDGFISEGFYQPSELGFGTHEKWKPPNAKQFKFGQKNSIYLNQPGMNTMVKSWCPTPGPQLGFLVTHDEAISISDYYTVKRDNEVIFRPTAMYAYHPCDDAVTSCIDSLGSGTPPTAEKWKILNEDIVEGIDELGVLIYGHSKNAYWYGSQLDIHRTRKIIEKDSQNATGLQVSSAVLAAVVWALENPEMGLVEPDQMDYKRCLEVQKHYIEPVIGVYTDWNPLNNKSNEFDSDAFDENDPWQFKNIITHK